MSIFIARNFKYSEFNCPDCGKNKPIDPHFIFLLQNLREKINRPIYISKGGGVRCKKYNREIFGYRGSAHLSGKAADIHAKNMGLIQLAREAKDIGFTRIGLYPDNYYVHVDTYSPRPSASWAKYSKGNYTYFRTLEEAIEFISKK